jgi:hypothetical protein
MVHQEQVPALGELSCWAIRLVRLIALVVVVYATVCGLIGALDWHGYIDLGKWLFGATWPGTVGSELVEMAAYVWLAGVALWAIVFVCQAFLLLFRSFPWPWKQDILFVALLVADFLIATYGSTARE